MTDLQKVICNALNNFCFLKIWNEPKSEYRVNIQPILLSTNSQYGTISINGNIITLPRTDEPFYIFSISKDCFRNGINIPKGVWYSSVTMCNELDTLVHVFSSTGKMCSHMDVYLYLLPTDNAYLLAVTKRTYTAMQIKPQNVKNTYITVYKDSDIANKTTLYSYKIPDNDRNGTYRLEIIKKLNELGNLDQVITYVNGFEVEFTDPNLLNYGDYVDIIHDTNIVASFIMDCTDNGHYWIYNSEKYEDNRLIVHMPKALNPENKVFTHNTCDFFIRRKTTKTFDKEGLYVQRTSPRGVKQITHQDFSISEHVLNAYRDYLGISPTIPDSQAVEIRVVVRQHDKDNVLLRDKNYIDMLYTQDDELILRCLKDTDRPTNAPTFWKASHLEQSVYVNMMFDIPNEITAENMWFYIEGLGYYHTLALLCPRIDQSKITDLFGGFITFNKPYLFKDLDVFPIVYKNGYKVHQSNLTIYQREHGESYTISFMNDIPTLGDTVSTEIFIDGNRQTTEFTVTSENRLVKVPYSEYIIYQVVDHRPATTSGSDSTYSFSYKKIDSLTSIATVQQDSEGNTTFVFSIRYLNETFIIQNKYCVRPISLTNALREKINKGYPLSFDLTTRTDLENVVPILEPQSIQIFLNGKYLIRDLDYHVVDILGPSKHLCMHQLIIQNKSYLLGKDRDDIEVFVTSAETEDSSFGFVKNDKILHSSNKVLALWFTGISSAHISGRQELDVTNRSSYMAVPEGKYRQGAPYELSTNLPTIVKDFVDEYHVNDDREQMEAINNYFYGLPADLSGMILLQESHQIYSVFIQTIMRDILEGRLILALDPDIPRMKKQVEPYEYLKQYDLVFKEDSLPIDLTYVDIFPTYSEWGALPQDVVILIHALMQLIMPEDTFSSGEIPHVNTVV